ncbi:MAG: alkene reductase, partial [Acetobacteraceae bacterium]|nr:alkene reductase [Acetobacteraceae bacterium]
MLDLFSPVQIGPYHLANRIVMAPMTRNRAGPGEAPTALMATYYAQRSSAALIVTEGTQITPQGRGYPGTPGIHSAAQVAGWRQVVNAVHARGGKIFCQLWHVGRVSHPVLQPGGALPVAPSALAPAGQLWTGKGMQPFVTPRALEIDEIAGLVRDYRIAAANAREAGFDGVELHAANGYLIDQFLRSSTNRRSDRYGGSIENRTRLLQEVTEALVGEFGGGNVGVRLSPTNPFNDIADLHPAALFGHAAAALARFALAYLHIVEPGPTDPIKHGERPDGVFFRAR